jgi:hypothetical protein
MNQPTRSALLLILAATLFSGCFLFRKKNRCGDCPKWNKAPVEQKDQREC